MTLTPLQVFELQAIANGQPDPLPGDALRRATRKELYAVRLLAHDERGRYRLTERGEVELMGAAVPAQCLACAMERDCIAHTTLCADGW